jgi:hypothetical protein
MQKEEISEKEAKGAAMTLPQSLTVQFALPNIPRSICIALSIPTAVF